MELAHVSILLERLSGLLFQRNKSKESSGLRSQIDGTMEELHKLRYFLRDADAQARRGNQKVRDLVLSINDIVLRFDNLVSRLVFTELSSKREGGRGGFINVLIKKLIRILKKKFRHRKVRSELDDLRTKIGILRSSLQNLGVKEIRELDDASFSGGGGGLQPSPVDFGEILERVVVDLSKTEEEDSSFVVSVCGKGGIGKTTLSRKLSRDYRVRRKFDSVAWVVVSKEFKASDVYAKMLIELNNCATAEEREEILSMNLDKVSDRLSQALKERKCLVVLDEIRTKEAWDRLKPAFSKVQMRNSRIFFTTGSKDVAIHADVKGFQHELRDLDEDESFKLFQKKAFGLTDLELNENVNEWTKEMLKHCSGLPLAISLLAGLMSARHSIDEWEMLYEDSKIYLERYDNEDSRLSWLLNLSFDDLPSYLKPCLLSLCLFPEDHEIKVNELCQIWIAEGFISTSPWQRGNSFQTMEDVAYECFCELVRRFTVQVEDGDSIGRIRTCRIHHLMRDFCILKASEESFLHSNDAKTVSELSSSKFQRLAVNGDYDSNSMVSLANNLKHAHLRSLVCTALSRVQLRKLCKPLLNNFHLLRVLKLENLKRVVRLPKDIGKLKDLRFLSIKHSEVVQVPSSIRYLRYLQTLDLRTASEVTLPNVIYKLKALRHLYLPCRSTVTDKKFFLNGLSSLQTLTNISVDCYQWNNLAHLTNLRRLKIYLDGNLRESYHPTCVTFNHVEFLAVKSVSGLMNLSGSTVDVVPIVLRYPRTYEIHVGRPIEKLPQDNQISSNLVKLTLVHTFLKDDPMVTLQNLPNMRILHLDCDAFLGFQMVCSRGGFPQLESLSLMNLFYLEKWRVDEGALSSLCHLYIKRCRRLMTVPDGLKSISTLKEMVIQEMPIEFEKRVGGEGVDFYKVMHVPSLVFLNTSESDSQGNFEVCRHKKRIAALETGEKVKMPDK